MKARIRSSYAAALNSQSASLVAAERERGLFGSNAKGERFPYSDSGSSRIRFTADLASHSRAFCRNSAALCNASFSFIRI